MGQAQEQGRRSFWTAKVLERDASGAPVRVRVLDRADDVEGEGWRYSRLGETEADVEGHPYRWILHEGRPTPRATCS